MPSPVVPTAPVPSPSPESVPVPTLAAPAGDLDVSLIPDVGGRAALSESDQSCLPPHVLTEADFLVWASSDAVVESDSLQSEYLDCMSPLGRYEVFAAGVLSEDDVDLARSELFCLWEGLSSVDQAVDDPSFAPEMSVEDAMEEFGRLVRAMVFGSVGLTLYCTAERDEPLVAFGDADPGLRLEDFDPGFVDWVLCQVEEVSGPSTFMSRMMLDPDYSSAIIVGFLVSSDASVEDPLFVAETLLGPDFMDSPVFQAPCGLPPGLSVIS